MITTSKQAQDMYNKFGDYVTVEPEENDYKTVTITFNGEQFVLDAMSIDVGEAVASMFKELIEFYTDEENYEVK